MKQRGMARIFLRVFAVTLSLLVLLVGSVWSEYNTRKVLGRGENIVPSYILHEGTIAFETGNIGTAFYSALRIFSPSVRTVALLFQWECEWFCRLLLHA